MVEKTTYLTSEGLAKLTAELEHLKKIKRPQISNRIKDAKELGDLSENAEYADAREQQSFTEGRIIELEAMLKDVEVIETKKNYPGTVEIGDTITVKRDNAKKEYTIIGSNEADPLNGRISNESPLGQAFLGQKKGATVTVTTPKGSSEWTIADIK